MRRTLQVGLLQSLALILAFAGSSTAMSQETVVPNPGTADTVATVHPIPGSYPVQFRNFDFGAICYSTRTCSVIFDDHEFTRLSMNVVEPPPSGRNYRDSWGDATYLGVRNFPKPAEVRWTSMDGVPHEAEVDIAAIFKDQWALNNVPAAEAVVSSTSPIGPLVKPSIFLEVNGLTINVYIKTMIFTKTDQEAGNRYSDYRDDLILVWTHNY